MNAHVAVLVEDEKIFEQIKKSGESCHFIFHHSPDLKEYLDDHFIICDVPNFLERKKVLKNIPKHLLYILSAGNDEENMKLVQEHELHHLVGLNEGILDKSSFAH